jgi:hypothetical protein
VAISRLDAPDLMVELLVGAKESTVLRRCSAAAAALEESTGIPDLKVVVSSTEP